MRNFSETALATLTNTMLYCPKCQKTYEENVGRFCPDDNTRLAPAASADKSANQTEGVFTSVLNRKTGEEGEKFSSVPKFTQSEPTFSRLNFRPPPSKIFKTEPELELELELEPPKIESKSSFIELPPLVKLRESAEKQPRTAEKQTQVEDEQTPTASPDNLIGEIVNNRFRIVEQISADENGTAYLAQDANEKFVVRVLKSEDERDKFAGKIYAEERNSLAQITHPGIARIVDSGELSGGVPYLVTEYVEGQTVGDFLRKTGQFNVLRTARVVRQTADALGAAHQVGVLHRGLKPENIILTADEDGIERVKLTGFGAAQAKLNEANLLYKSPEQVEGKLANFTSDGFSLAVIAYQMLTNRLPFNAASVGDLLKAQREGVKLFASDLRDDLPASIDQILEKALSFNPFERYEKVQDFGDEFFGEIFANAPLEIDEEVVETVSEEEAEPIFVPPTPAEETKRITPVVADDFTPAIREVNRADGSGVKATEDLAWEKRSPEMPNEPSPSRNLFSILGVGVLLAVLLGVWYYFINRPSQTFVATPVEIVNQNQPTIETSPITEPSPTAAPTAEEVEAPPLPRQMKQPPNTEFFQNTKENLKGDLAKNFLGFSLYYPKDWKRNEAPKNFLDISKTTANGLPVEQMLVTYYNSKGTFKTDAGIFPAKVKETNDDLKKILPNYRMISEGRKMVNNGWQAYEVEFQGTGKTAKGEEIVIWGKRLFIPTAIRGMKNGYVVTMLATSLSKDVKSIEDVGIKGELASILETFEPNQNF